MVVECVGKDILLTMKSSCSSPLVSQAYKIHPLFRATNITALKCIQSAFLSLLNCKPRWIGSHIKRNNRLLTVFFRAQPQLQGNACTVKNAVFDAGGLDCYAKNRNTWEDAGRALISLLLCVLTHTSCSKSLKSLNKKLISTAR